MVVAVSIQPGSLSQGHHARAAARHPERQQCVGRSPAVAYQIRVAGSDSSAATAPSRRSLRVRSLAPPTSTVSPTCTGSPAAHRRADRRLRQSIAESRSQHIAGSGVLLPFLGRGDHHDCELRKGFSKMKLSGSAATSHGHCQLLKPFRDCRDRRRARGSAGARNGGGPGGGSSPGFFGECFVEAAGSAAR